MLGAAAAGTAPATAPATPTQAADTQGVADVEPPPGPNDTLKPYEQVAQTVAWFRGMTDAQRNETLRQLLLECRGPQFHILAGTVGSVMHQQCPDNCQDPVGWLPDDVALCVLSFLDAVSLCRAAQVGYVCCVFFFFFFFFFC